MFCIVFQSAISNTFSVKEENRLMNNVSRECYCLSWATLFIENGGKESGDVCLSYQLSIHVQSSERRPLDKANPKNDSFRVLPTPHCLIENDEARVVYWWKERVSTKFKFTLVNCGHAGAV